MSAGFLHDVDSTTLSPLFTVAKVSPPCVNTGLSVDLDGMPGGGRCSFACICMLLSYKVCPNVSLLVQQELGHWHDVFYQHDSGCSCVRYGTQASAVQVLIRMMLEQNEL